MSRKTFKEPDARVQTQLTPEQVQFFATNGYLVIRNVLCEDELESLRNATRRLIDEASTKRGDPDYWFNDEIPETWYKVESMGTRQLSFNKPTNRGIPFRIEYPIDKSEECQVLLGHPFILRAIEQLISPDFIPTWDSLVFKAPGDGVPIKWHRDASAESVDNVPAVDVGFYLDDARFLLDSFYFNGAYPPSQSTEQDDNCLYAIPGSHRWPDQLASQMLDYMSKDGFRKHGTVAIPVKAGDVLMHNILLLHGSPACCSPLRRTIYYEFRSIHQELAMGPHIPEYIPKKQRVLLSCLRKRKSTNYDLLQKQPPFIYNVSEKYRIDWDDEASPDPDTYRYPHAEYFRPDYRG